MNNRNSLQNGDARSAKEVVDLSSEMGSGFAALRNDGTPIDVTLMCDDGQTIVAHRVVLSAQIDYFTRVFTGEMAEAKQCVIRMEGLSFAALRQIVDFAYTNKFCVCTEGVFELLQASNNLGVMRMKTECERYLIFKIDLANCLALLKLAEESAASKLYAIAFVFVIENFMHLSKTDQFMKFECVESLNKLLSHDHLAVRAEEQVFISVVQWTNHDRVNRMSMFPLLIRHVRFSLLSHCFCKFVRNCDLVNASFKADTLLKPLFNGSVDAPRTIRTLICIGGQCPIANSQKSVELFDPIEYEWRVVSFGQQHQKTQIGVGCVGTKLFVVGGKMLGRSLSTVECLDVRSGEWTPLAPLKAARQSPALVVLDEKYLFAIGGWGDGGALDTVEKYDIEHNMWSDAASLSVCIGQVAAAVYGGHIFVVGRDKCERYDPRANKWDPFVCMLQQRGRCGVVVVADHLYAIGGNVEWRSPLRSCERYSFSENKWTAIESLSTDFESLFAVAVGRRIFTICSMEGFGVRNRVVVFDTFTGKWSRAASLNSQRDFYGVASITLPSQVLHACLRSIE